VRRWAEGGTAPGDRPPRRAASASWKSPVDTPAGRELAGSASRLFVRRAHFGRIDEVKRIFSSAHPAGTFTGKFAQGIVDEGVGFGDQLLAQVDTGG